MLKEYRSKQFDLDSFYFPSQFLNYWVALLQDENKKNTRFYPTFVDWLFTFWSQQHSIKELQGTCINKVKFTLEFILSINTCIFSINKSENI